MGSSSTFGNVLFALVIFVLGFAELGSSNEHSKKPKDHPIAPKVFIIDMVCYHASMSRGYSHRLNH